MKKLYYILSLLVTISLSACSGGSEHDHDHDHDHCDGHDHGEHHEGEHEHSGEEHEAHSSEEIILKPEVAKRMGVEFKKLAPEEFCEVIRVGGQVMPAPSDVAVATAPTSGIVTLSSGIAPGNTVSQGAAIATVSSKGMTGGDTNKQARLAIDAAKRELDRAKPLHDEGIVTTKEYNELLARYEAAKAAYSPSAASGTATSPISGVITGVLVRQGEYVEAGQPIAQISRTSRLTLRADLPERYARFLSSVRSANFRGSNSDEVVVLDELGGRLTSGASMASATGGYFPVYFTFNNNGSVVPGTYVEVFLKGTPKAGAIIVPKEALTEQQGSMYVYVKIDDEGYERRLVTVGGTDGKNVEVLSGIAPGDIVVTKGATVVRLAENSGSIPEGHSHNH